LNPLIQSHAGKLFEERAAERKSYRERAERLKKRIAERSISGTV
jgi:hypothetical protein